MQPAFSESDRLIDALRRLPDHQAEVIALAFFGDLDHSEITKQLDLPDAAAKGRMRLGLHIASTTRATERNGGGGCNGGGG